MLSISHALTGAFIAYKLPNPILYIPLVLASHYIEDWILHWDVGTGLSNGSRKRSTAFFLELIDLAIAGILVLVLFRTDPLSLLPAPHVLFGAFLGLLPDFLEAPRNFIAYNPPWLKPLNDFHHNFHHSTPNMLMGLLPQAVVLTIILLFR